MDRRQLLGLVTSEPRELWPTNEHSWSGKVQDQGCIWVTLIHGLYIGAPHTFALNISLLILKIIINFVTKSEVTKKWSDKKIFMTKSFHDKNLKWQKKWSDKKTFMTKSEVTKKVKWQKNFHDKKFSWQNFHDKNFHNKNFHDKNIFMTKSFQDKIFMTKIFMTKIFMTKTFSWQKVFMTKSFYDKIFITRIFMTKTFCPGPL